ncbi:tRNA-splicing endonuclease subunit Sen34 [Scyliorhinus torazame]|uniref:tRNA-splicing endonuclease subunit Sen34 n=1 Tax=Scyliorhinus torazame TaxID=75743 RepID=UPI003B5974D0
MILIHVAEGQALVWSAEEARELRERHGLCGTPVGSLARQPRQNGRLGLPLRLLPEEATLLAERGLALLVKARGRGGAGPGPSEEEQGNGQLLERLHADQRALALEEKRALLEGLSEHIKQGRQMKRGRRRQPGAGSEAVDVSLGPSRELEDLDRNFSFTLENTLTQIHTSCPHARQLDVVNWRVPSTDWHYPGDPAHALRYCVFKDLHDKGYQLTSGGKFGGDYLIYPGDPMRFHAHFIAICVPYEEGLPLHDTVTAGRLGSNVKKTVLLCSVTKDKTVIYTSLRWRGIQ